MSTLGPFDLNHVHQGDCIELLKQMPRACIDAVVTDPPYELGFAGKAWDSSGISFRPLVWSAVRRVAKPGAHMLAFGGSRTFHRIAVAIEDAGWEIRDVIMWLYSSGMPKSMEAGKLIDKAAGVEREVVGKVIKTCDIFSGTREREVDVTLPATNAAKKWKGWGTTLRPAYEPIIVARNPFEGTIADNVLRRGTGVLNIDGCRIQTSGESAGGRFPANVIHDGSPEVLDAFPIASEDQLRPGAYLGGAGSAARFFYCC